MNLTKNRLVIVRHGNTFKKGDVILRVGNKTDLDLVEVDRSRNAGLFIRNNGFDIKKVLSGPLKRHLQSANIISEVIGFEKSKIVVDKRLDELDYGLHDGKYEDEVVRDIGEYDLKKWNDEAIPPKAWDIDVELIKDNWRLLLEECLALETGHDAVAVTSNGILRFLPFILSSRVDVESLKIPTGGIVVLEKVRSFEWEIVKWG